VAVPLYAKNVLGMATAEYSMLVWMRAFSVFGLVLIGSYSHEFGPRRVSIYLLICSAVLMLLLFTCPTKFFGVTLALLSTCVEAALMPINALTQGVDVARAGRVNTLFRAVDIGAHIVVPLVFTSSTWGVVAHSEGSTSFFLLCVCMVAALQVLGASCLHFLPLAVAAPKSASTGSAFHALTQTGALYMRAFGIKSLRGFLLTINVVPLLDSVVRGFLAYRLVELGESDALFGVGSSLAAIFAFVSMLTFGGWLDLYPIRASILALTVADALAFLVTAVTRSPMLTVAMYALHCMLFKLCASVESMWTTRASGEHLNAAIALRKVFGMAYKFMAGAVWSWVVQSVGLSGLYALCVIIYVPVIICLALLPEPPVVAKKCE